MPRPKALLHFILPSGRATRLDLVKAVAVTMAFTIPYSLVAYVPMPREAMLALLAVCLVVLLFVASLIWAGLVQPPPG
jgi:hypothetical protein